MKIVLHLHSIQFLVTNQDLFVQELHLTSHLGLPQLMLEIFIMLLFLTVKEDSSQVKCLLNNLLRMVKLQHSMSILTVMQQAMFTSIPTTPLQQSKAYSAPTAVFSARWVTPSVSARASIRTLSASTI